MREENQPPPAQLSSVFNPLLVKGEEIIVEGNVRYYLKDSQYVWFVEEEGGDVFIFDPEDEKFLPSFLVEINSGGLLLGITTSHEEKEYSLFFVCPRRTRLTKVSISDIRSTLLDHPEMLSPLTHLIENWVNQLLIFFPSAPDEKITKYFQLEDTFPLHPEESCALARTFIPEEKNHIAWLEVLEGKCFLLANPLYPLPEKGIYFPLSHALWVKSTAESTLTSHSTANLLREENFWEGINHFHRLLFIVLLNKKKLDIEKTLLKIQKKASAEEEIIQSTFYKLGSVLNKKIAIGSPMEGNALLEALELMGQALNVKFSTPAFFDASQTIEEQIRQICLASNFYFRKLTLKGKWWKGIAHPILCFEKETMRPLAIIPVKGNKFVIMDPSNRSTQPLNKNTVNGLSLTGYVFYEGFSKDKPNLWDLFKTAFRFNKNDFLSVVGVAIAGGGVNLFLPFAMKELFDTLILTEDTRLLTEFTLGLVIAAFSTAIFTITKNYAALRIEGISNYKLETSLWGRLLTLPASFFRKYSSGILMNNLYAFQHMRQVSAESCIKFMISLVYCLFYLFIMFSFSWYLTVVGLGGLFLAIIVFSFCIYFHMKLEQQSYTLASKIQGMVVQIIAGIPKIRVAGAEGRFFALWGDLFSSKKKIDMKMQYLNAIQSLVYRLLPLIMTTLLFSTAILLLEKTVIDKETVGAPIMTIGSFLGFNTAYSLFTLSALEILKLSFSLSSILPMWRVSKNIVEEPKEKREVRMQEIKLHGAVSLDHVSFRYVTSGELILKDISFHANPGEMVAIVGPTGCGKSTIVRMLLGFDSPEHGDILYDGQPITNFDLRSIRKQIGTVLQNAGVLSGSIYENIVGSGNYSIEQIENAIRLSGFEEDLKALPMGLNTVLPMGGGSFSGGQRQRLYLARALVSSPKILILDEATSALDNKTQDLVSSNLDQIEVTRIVIAHRLSTIKHADRIYVMEDGQIVESGTFAELQEKNGLFALMLKRQQM